MVWKRNVGGVSAVTCKSFESAGRDIFQYYHYDLKASSMILIVVNFSRLTIRSDDLYVFFDKRGVVDEVVFGKRTEGMEFRHWPFGN